MPKPREKHGKEIIFNVYNYFEKRKKDTSTQEYQNDVNLRTITAEVTGVTSGHVSTVVREGRNMLAQYGILEFKNKKVNRKKKKFFDVQLKGVVRRMQLKFYTHKNTIPSLKSLLQEIKNQESFECSVEHFRTMLYDLGFRYYSNYPRKKVLIEHHKITAQRLRYLEAIKKYRSEGRPIVYVGESYFSLTDEAISAEDPRPREYIGIIAVHAGTRDGFIKKGLTLCDTYLPEERFVSDIKVFYHNWFNQLLLTNIPQNSVVVMSSASYHNALLDVRPTMTSTKEGIQKWLIERDVVFDPDLRKCELITLVNQQPYKKRYKLDELLMSRGHTALRLPPRHPDLNAIELVWEDIRRRFEIINKGIRDPGQTIKKKKIKQMLKDYTTEQWLACEELVLKNEEEYREIDEKFDEAFDRLVPESVLASCNTEEDDDFDESDEDSDIDYE